MGRAQVVEIFAPTKGIKVDVPSHLLDPRNQPDGLNGSMYYGVNQKEYGTSLYCTGMGSALGADINAIYDCRFPNSNVLEVFTATGVYKYTAGGDTLVSDGQVFTGTYTDFWNGVMHNDQFIYSNGIDNMQIKPTVGATGTALASAVSPTTYKAWALQSVNDHLCLYHLVENGTEYFKRVRWSKKGVLTTTAGATDFALGVAGGIDVQDCEGEIKTAVSLSGAIAVYSERSIHIQYWVGSDEVFKFQKTISGVGTPSRRGAVSMNDVNYLFSHDAIYAYYGGDDLRTIDDDVNKEIYSTVNNSGLAHVLVEPISERNEVLFHIPTGSSTRPDTTWVYKVTDKSWQKLARAYTSYGRSTRKTGLTIGELQGTIGDQTWKFGEAYIRVEAMVQLWGDQSGRLVKYDPTLYSISASGTSSPQTFIYETPDLTALNVQDPITKEQVKFSTVSKRWVGLNLELYGAGTAYVYYSTDRGTTYTSIPTSPLTLVTAGENYQEDLDVVSKTLRIKITNTATNEWVGVGYVSLDCIPQGRQA